MSPSRGTAAKSDAVLSERLTGQGEDARPAFGRREPACRGCAGSPGWAQEDNVEGGEGFHAGGEAPDSSARRPARAALQAQTCSLPPPAPSSAGPGPGGRPLCQRQSHTLHARHPLGLAGPASCHRPSAFEARGAGEGTREDPGGGGPSGRAESAGPAARGYWCLHGVRREWGETLASRGRGGRGFRHAAPPDARGAVNVTAGSRPPAGSPGSVVRLLRAAPVQTHSRYLERFLHQTRNNRWQQLTADPIRKWTSLSLEA